MEPDTKEAQQARVAQRRKVLETGTWPEVMAVFGYRNPRTERKSEGEFARIKEIFGQANCLNIAAFIKLVQFEEERLGVAMSFNLSLRRRTTPGETATIAENPFAFLLSPDLLVGTRRGVESAFHWFENLSKAVRGNEIAPESVQIFDKIFGEAIEFFKGTPRTQTVGDLFTEAVSPDAGLRRDRFKPPFKQ